MDNLPTGNITTEELLADIQQRTNGRPRKPPAGPRKGKDAFPLATLPPKLQGLVEGAETALGVPPDFLAAAVLWAASVAAGGTFQLEIKKEVTQQAVFFLVLVATPNSNKSGALKFVLRPIIARDNERWDAHQAAKAEFDALASLSKKERAEQGVTEMPAMPVFTRSLVADITPEALVATHQDNPRGIAVYRDELAGWVKDFNRYHQGGELEFWLSVWSLIAITVDRKTAEPVRVKSPFIPVAGTIQPGVIEALARDNRTQNGFIDRLLFVWPEGLEKPEWTEDEINLYLVGDYEQAINRLLGLSFTEDFKPHTLTLTPKAKARLFQFFNQENKPLCDGAESELLAGIYGKFDFHTARLVIAFHLLWWAYQGQGGTPPLEVQPETVERAIAAAKYFQRQALKVYERLHNEGPVDRLPADKRKVYEALPEAFKTADGEAIAERLGMPARTFRKFLNDGKGKLFDKPKYGQWAKNY